MVKKKGKSKRVSLKDKYKVRKKSETRGAITRRAPAPYPTYEYYQVLFAKHSCFLFPPPPSNAKQVQRRVVESHRKSRKQAKRDAKAGIVRPNKRTKKDPGIPNSWPFKQDLLNDIARAKERAEQKKADEKQQKQDRLRALSEHKKAGGTARSYEEMMVTANRDAQEFASNANRDEGVTADGDGMRTEQQSLGQQSRRAYLKELKKVIDGSDVILQVLDARDPIGTRIHPSIEDAILRHYDKKMVLVLNKIDLVPKEAVAGWLAYLRKSGRPTIAMKAGTNQSRSGNVGQAKGESALKSSSGVGADSLLHLLKNYARHAGGDKKASTSKACITVGIIGYPNVGKSSILNTMKRSRAVGVSPRPGFTTAMQEVVLDRSVRLLDSPGVVFDDVSGSNDQGGHALLRNCVDADSVNDPIPAVQGLLERCSTESLMMTYTIPAFPKNDAMVFLALVAKRSGRVLKGGVPDKVSAARTVIRDWNGGKIPYYTMPPETTALEGEDKNEGAVVVSSFADELDLQKLDAEVLKDLPEDGMDYVKIEPIMPANSEKVDKAARYLTAKAGHDDEESSSDEDEDMAMDDNDKAADAEDYDFEDM